MALGDKMLDCERWSRINFHNEDHSIKQRAATLRYDGDISASLLEREYYRVEHGQIEDMVWMQEARQGFRGKGLSLRSRLQP